ncbi:MAG: long-chain fatty acid--CoA ligase [Nocardioidaceae bacterium]|nr:long-chain fatty acid--CoA ligase [Nocardioidaceae bacterium]
MRCDEKFASIPALVQGQARELGDATYLIDGDESWSFAETEARMLAAARGFIALGVQPGDRVALCAPNSALWIQATLGLQAAGAILVPLSTRFKASEIAYVLASSRATVLITAGSFLGTDYVEIMRDAVAESGTAPQIVVLDGEHDGAVSFADMVDRGASVPEQDALDRIAAIRGADLSDIMFTSGTTGASKGVRLRHSQALRGFEWLGNAFGYQRGETFAVIPPFFHSFGYKAGWLSGLIQGMRVIPVKAFDALGLLELIQTHQVNVLNGPPTIFIDLMNHPRRTEFDISSLRVGTTGAATIPLKVIQDMHDVLGFEVVINAYGLTESTALVSSSRPDDDPELVASTVGRPADGLEVIIVDDEGKELPYGDDGEIWVRGYLVMEGYWENPEATAEAITPDGFLRTGDIGNIDAQGFIKVTDRKKDMYIVGGFNAYPAEIEAALTRHDKIVNVAVIGVPDDRMGEVGWAYVIPKTDSGLTEDDVIAYARENLANFKVPRRVVLVDELPLTPSMKVSKLPLRDHAMAQLAEAK